jgi:ATP-binding cassette subfamily F protein uup
VKFSFKEQRDFETIEDTLMQLEEKVDALAAEIEANSADYVKVAALMAEQEETQRKLDEATERWLFLQEKWEQIQAAKNG